MIGLYLQWDYDSANDDTVEEINFRIESFRSMK